MAMKRKNAGVHFFSAGSLSRRKREREAQACVMCIDLCVCPYLCHFPVPTASVSAVMKLLSGRMSSGQGVKDKNRQGNQLSEATYFRSSR